MNMQAPIAARTNPFPGLRPFREAEEYLFFGRKARSIRWSTNWRRHASWPLWEPPAAAKVPWSTPDCVRLFAEA